jgi:hypothetical protein
VSVDLKSFVMVFLKLFIFMSPHNFLQLWAVVEPENEEGALFVVSQTWMYENNGDIYSKYPPKSSKNSEQMAAKSLQPSSNWETVKVNVLKDNLREILNSFSRNMF